MKITRSQINLMDNTTQKERDWCLGECKEEEDLHSLLLRVNRFRPMWAAWVFTKFMSKAQCIDISIFAADKVSFFTENLDIACDDIKEVITLSKQHVQVSSNKLKIATSKAKQITKSLYGKSINTSAPRGGLKYQGAAYNAGIAACSVGLAAAASDMQLVRNFTVECILAACRAAADWAKDALEEYHLEIINQAVLILERDGINL